MNENFSPVVFVLDLNNKDRDGFVVVETLHFACTPLSHAEGASKYVLSRLTHRRIHLRAKSLAAFQDACDSATRLLKQDVFYQIEGGGAKFIAGIVITDNLAPQSARSMRDSLAGEYAESLKVIVNGSRMADKDRDDNMLVAMAMRLLETGAFAADVDKQGY